jgi:hypothetical protein
VLKDALQESSESIVHITSFAQLAKELESTKGTGKSVRIHFTVPRVTWTTSIRTLNQTKTIPTPNEEGRTGIGSFFIEKWHGAKVISITTRETIDSLLPCLRRIFVPYKPLFEDQENGVDQEIRAWKMSFLEDNTERGNDQF